MLNSGEKNLVAVGLAVVLTLLAVGWGGVLLVRNMMYGAPPSFLFGKIGSSSKQPIVDEDHTRLRVAGSGTNLPLTRRLAQAFREEHSDAMIVVHESIGSRGGIQAAVDGVIELGLVSRTLKPSESSRDVVALPYAKVAVVFASHPSVPARDLSSEQALRIFAGELSQWSDGTAVRVLQREEGDSGVLAAAEFIEGFGEVDLQARLDGRWRVLDNDLAMQHALQNTPGAVGIFDRGAVTSQQLVLNMLSLNGVQASEVTVRDGEYPLQKTLAFVRQGKSTRLAEEFVAFVFSPRGKMIISELGYVALERGEWK